MATSKSKTKAPKVGTFRGGSKSKVGGRGGFMGKTSSGGNLGRAAMMSTDATAAAKGFGRTAGASAAAFAIGPVGGGSAAPGAGIGNASGAGVDYSADGLIETILNPGGTPYNVGPVWEAEPAVGSGGWSDPRYRSATSAPTVAPAYGPNTADAVGQWLDENRSTGR